MRFASNFRHSSSIVAVVRADSAEFVDVNPAFEARIGYRREEVLGKLPVEIGLWPDLDVRARIWSRLRTEASVHDLPVQVAARDGQTFAARLSCELFDADDQRYVLCLLTDDRSGTVAGGEESPESYRSLFRAAAEGIYRRLPGGGFIDANPALAKILGFESAHALLASHARETASLYVDPDRSAQLQARLDADGSFENERSRVRRRDGGIVWVSENGRAILDRNDAVRFYEGSVIDITDSLAAEQALRQSEALYKVLVDSCRDGVFLIQRGVIRFCNRALAEIFGYTPEQMIGLEYMTLVHPDDLAEQARRRAAREAGSTEVQKYEVRVIRKDGRFAAVAVHADAVIYEGDIASTGVMREVTAERRQREALEAAERRYRELFESSPIGLFKTHLDGRVLEANPALLAMLGYSNLDDLRRLQPRMEEVYADPTQRVGVLAELKRAGVVRGREIWLRDREGNRLLGSVSARLIPDETGESSEVAGSVIDITRSHRMAAELARSEARYRTLVEHSQVGVFISDGERYVYVNRYLANMLDYDEQDLLRLPHERLVAPEFLPQLHERRARLSAGEAVTFDFESCYLRRDGARVWVTVSTGPIEIDGRLHVTGTVRDITRHREAEQRLRFHASHDALTGLPNRLMFQEALERVMREARRSGRYQYAVLFLDLDGFKLVNDGLGHAVGDLLLVTLADKIATALDDKAMLARYGGDEFTILCEDCDGPERAVALAERVIGLFSAPFDVGEHHAWSSASIGIVTGRPDYTSPVEVLRDADTAMYRAKAAGKSGFVVFDDAMHAAARDRFRLENDLRGALARAEFRVHFQPIVALADGRILGSEALLRWQHPQRGLLLPGAFLRVAEEAGLIAAIDGWVLEQACAQLVVWQQMDPALAELHVNVNIDDRQMSSPSLIDEVAAVLARTGVRPDRVYMEVTETVFRADRVHAEQTLRALKALGVTLVVDDFGTGYSSLDSFAASPFDALKIDRGFVRDMESNGKHRAIVRTIIAFADDLGLALTAEGVESRGQAELLQAMGCKVGQGFLYAQAMAPTALTDTLRGGTSLDAGPAFRHSA